MGERAGRAFYSLWWLSLPLAGGGVIAILAITLRWVLDGGIRRFDADAFLPWLATGLGLALWLVVPAGLYLATVPVSDHRASRLLAAVQRAAREFGEWVALPMDLIYSIGRWGVLLVLVGVSIWALLAGGDPGSDALRRAVPIAIRFALFLLLYLITTTIVALAAGLWALLWQRGTAREAASEARALVQPTTSDKA